VNNNKLLEEHTERIYELYQNKSKSFQKWFQILFSFALLFLFIILIPYISIRTLNNKTLEKQKLIEEKIEERKNSIKTYIKILDGVEILHKKMESGPNELIAFIDSLKQILKESQSISNVNNIFDQSLQAEPIQSRLVLTEATFKSIIQEEVEDRFSNYQQIIRNEIFEPLQELKSDTIKTYELDAIISGLATLEEIFKNKLSENPDFWHTIPGKREFYLGLDEDIERFWEIHGSTIQKQSAKIKNEVDNLTKENTRLKEQISTLHVQSKQLDERLKQIEFPFGKLPIGLDESIAVFPVLLAIGFFVCIFLLRDSIRLRENFHRLYQQKDPKQAVVDSEQIMLVAPLWIDPENQGRKNFIPISILSILFLIFIVSCSIIIYSWFIPGTFKFAVRFNWLLYGGLYALSFLIFVYSYWQIFKEVKNYSAFKE